MGQANTKAVHWDFRWWCWLRIHHGSVGAVPRGQSVRYKALASRVGLQDLLATWLLGLSLKDWPLRNIWRWDAWLSSQCSNIRDFFNSLALRHSKVSFITEVQHHLVCLEELIRMLHLLGFLHPWRLPGPSGSASTQPGVNAATFAATLDSSQSNGKSPLPDRAHPYLGHDQLIAQALSQALTGERRAIPTWNGAAATL